LEWEAALPSGTGPHGHLLSDSEDYLRGLLDAYDERGELETEAFSPLICRC